MSKDNEFPGWHGTTIVSVRKGNKVVIAGDGQVSVGNTVMKHNARKVRRLTGDLGRASLAEAIPLRDLRARKIGRDVWLEGEIARDEGESNV